MDMRFERILWDADSSDDDVDRNAGTGEKEKLTGAIGDE